MPVKNNVGKSYKKLVGKIAGDLTEDVVTKISAVGLANALSLTPNDTGNLINSQFRDVKQTSNGWSAKVGFTANYAYYVHEAKGVLLGTNTPRGKGRSGNVWDPDAEPQFLVKGFERDGAEEIQQIIKRGYKL